MSEKNKAHEPHKPEIWNKPETLFAVVKMGKENKVMPFAPGAPMYHEVVAANIGFRTEKFCQKYLDGCQELEKKCRSEEVIALKAQKEKEEKKEKKDE